MKKCPVCNYETSNVTNNFCFKDGTKLIETDSLCLCGYEYSPVDKYCVKCGAKRNVDTTTN
jgi:hypothetical protein